MRLPWIPNSLAMRLMMIGVDHLIYVSAETACRVIDLQKFDDDGWFDEHQRFFLSSSSLCIRSISRRLASFVPHFGLAADC